LGWSTLFSERHTCSIKYADKSFTPEPFSPEIIKTLKKNRLKHAVSIYNAELKTNIYTKSNCVNIPFISLEILKFL